MRESCISHKPKSLLLVIREDYFRLTKCDKVLTALLSVFEYWANGEISKNTNESEGSINLGVRTISEIEKLTLWIATDKQIRIKLKELEKLGFISIHKGVGNYTAYTLHISYLQQVLNTVDWSIPLAQLRSLNPCRCAHTSGLLTEPPPVNKPHPSGLLTEPLYIEEINKNSKKECVEEAAHTQTQIAETEVCVFEELDAQQVSPTIATDTNQSLLKKTDSQPVEILLPAQVEVETNTTFNPKLENLMAQLDKGELKDLPIDEKKQLANYLMGEQIKLYRKSGYILATNPNDINTGFLRYVAWKDLKQPSDLGWARNTVLSYERDMTKWGQLVALVEGWQTVTPEEVAEEASARVAAKRGSKEDLQIAIQSSIDAYKEIKNNPFRRKA
jgi:hypothetical protein